MKKRFFLLILACIVRFSYLPAQIYIKIEINQPQELSVVELDTLTAYYGESVQLGIEVIASGGSGLFSYLWEPSTSLDFNNIPNPLASPAVSTTYNLKVTDGNGCELTTKQRVELTQLTSSRPETKFELIEIYPNPGDGVFLYKIHAPSCINLTVFNLAGQEVYKEQIIDISLPLTGKIDLRKHPKGCYLLSIKNSSLNHYQLIIIH